MPLQKTGRKRRRRSKKRRICPGCSSCCFCSECQNQLNEAPSCGVGARGPPGPRGDEPRIETMDEMNAEMMDHASEVRDAMEDRTWIMKAIGMTEPDFRDKLLRVMQSPEIQMFMATQPAELKSHGDDFVDSMMAGLYPTIAMQFGDTIVMGLGHFYEQKTGKKPFVPGGYDAEAALYKDFDPFLDSILDRYETHQQEMAEFREWKASHGSK